MGMDGRLINLGAQNAGKRQQRRKVGMSGYKGVTRNYSSKKDSWVARIKYNGKQIHIGCYASPKDAFEAYVKKDKELRN